MMELIVRTWRLFLTTAHKVVYFGKRHTAFGERKSAAVLHFMSGAEKGAEAHARQSRTHADAAHPSGGEIGCGETVGADQYVDWLWSDGGANCFDLIESTQSWRIENIGARRCEGVEAADGVVQVRDAVKEIFCPRGKREREGQCARGRDGCRDALQGMRMVVDWPMRITASVFDRTAHKAGFGRQTDGLSHDFRVVAEAVLKIPGDWKVRGVHNCAD